MRSATRIFATRSSTLAKSSMLMVAGALGLLGGRHQRGRSAGRVGYRAAAGVAVQLRAASSGCECVLLFDFGHDVCQFLWCAGEDRGERAEFRAGFEAAPFEIVQFAVLRGEFDVAEAELRPDLCGGGGKDRIEQRRNDPDGFGSGVEDGIKRFSSQSLLDPSRSSKVQIH